MTCIFSVGGGPPSPGSGWDDPVTDGIEEILGKEKFFFLQAGNSGQRIAFIASQHHASRFPGRTNGCGSTS